MSNGRFASAGLSVKPKETWCSSTCVVDPINDFVQDPRSRAIETLLLRDQPDSTRTNQRVQTEVFSDLLRTGLNVEKCPITKVMHQRIELRVVAGYLGSRL